MIQNPYQELAAETLLNSKLFMFPLIYYPIIYFTDPLLITKYHKAQENSNSKSEDSGWTKKTLPFQ